MKRSCSFQQPAVIPGIEFFKTINIARDFPSATLCHFREHYFDRCADYVQGLHLFLSNGKKIYICSAYFFFLHKVHKSCPFDLHGLTLPVIQRQDEMEKIGFSEVGRGLLFIMCPCQADTAAGREQETSSVKHRTPGMLEMMEKLMETLEMQTRALGTRGGDFLICHNNG